MTNKVRSRKTRVAASQELRELGEGFGAPQLPPVAQDELLTTKDAVALTKMSKAWFEKQRWIGQGPPYRKRGRAVRYLRSELLAWFTELRPGDFPGEGH
ncbi:MULTISPECIES: helix-turn-helix transcriptional regulator [Dyella]|uniref:DNA-binding protein n=2 Tax=Dyella TaxID=231454 RepID=A0A4R0Z385_9GAMM|nr:DNA-binding protein [Dyella terrae]TCI12800.1 DNA-binding protein [Dyella soli]